MGFKQQFSTHSYIPVRVKRSTLGTSMPIDRAIAIQVITDTESLQINELGMLLLLLTALLVRLTLWEEPVVVYRVTGGERPYFYSNVKARL